MSVKCKYERFKTYPLSYTLAETFDAAEPAQELKIILVENGCVTLRINQERCFLQAGALIFTTKNTVVEKLFSQGLIAKSLSFDPQFIDPNLSPDHILREEFDDVRSEYGYPSFHLFYDWSYAYSNVLPLSSLVRTKVCSLFNEILHEIDQQPDSRWSCRARMNLLALLRLAEEEYQRFTSSDLHATTLACMTLEYIHTNYDREITVDHLCEMYHTNHTTLLRNFRMLTGTTIGQYIMEYRIQLAKEALLFTNLTVEEVALKFGFRQATYLSRVFKTRTGMTPGQFRRLMTKQSMEEKGGFQDVFLDHEPTGQDPV